MREFRIDDSLVTVYDYEKEEGLQTTQHSGGVHVSTWTAMRSVTITLTPEEAIRFGFRLVGLGVKALRGRR